MTNAAKGALLSGIVFPGLGQIIQKRYLVGVSIMVIVLVSLATVVVKGVRLGLAILEGMADEGVAIDMYSITDAASRAAGGDASTEISLLIVFIIICWAGGIMDALYNGRVIDRKSEITSKDI